MTSCYPNVSPLWGNVKPGIYREPIYDEIGFWHWAPVPDITIWFDTPMTTEELGSSNVCYRLQGNVWFCPTVAAEQLPPVVVPLPTGNVKPMLSVTLVKMENHPEHVAVMFGQVLSNLNKT